MEPKDGFCIVNGEVVPSSQQHDLFSEHTVVYEVIRIVGGRPLFFRQHMLRLENSCRIANVVLVWSSLQIRHAIQNLVFANNAQNVNLKIEVFVHSGCPCYQMFLIPSSYPEEALYNHGVSVGLLQAERANPNAKILNRPFVSHANELMKKNNWYEVLLVNGEGEVTEGSRSNFFLIEKTSIITPPLKSVLPGITRQMVLKIALELGLEVKEISVPAAALSNYQAAFLSGTSPGILPIATIDDIAYSPINPTYLKLREAYNQLVFDDLSSFTYDGIE
ncbi:MAG TPA: aminotransferase class IV [Williamwhitmania sp.]|nr:aminotransferase class IV [Williamwhitmania sp.]